MAGSLVMVHVVGIVVRLSPDGIMPIWTARRPPSTAIVAPVM